MVQFSDYAVRLGRESRRNCQGDDARHPGATRSRPPQQAPRWLYQRLRRRPRDDPNPLAFFSHHILIHLDSLLSLPPQQGSSSRRGRRNEGVTAYRFSWACCRVDEMPASVPTVAAAATSWQVSLPQPRRRPLMTCRMPSPSRSYSSTLLLPRLQTPAIAPVLPDLALLPAPATDGVLAGTLGFGGAADAGAVVETWSAVGVSSSMAARVSSS